LPELVVVRAEKPSCRQPTLSGGDVQPCANRIQSLDAGRVSADRCAHLPAAGLDLAGASGRRPGRGCLAARAEDRPPRGADRAVRPSAAQGARGSGHGSGAACSLSRRPPRQAGVALEYSWRCV